MDQKMKRNTVIAILIATVLAVAVIVSLGVYSDINSSNRAARHARRTPVSAGVNDVPVVTGSNKPSPMPSPVSLDQLQATSPMPVPLVMPNGMLAPNPSTPTLATLTESALASPRTATASLSTSGFAAMPRPVSIDGDAEDSHAAASLVGDTLQRQIDQLANDDDLLDPGEKARRFVMSLCRDQQGRLWVGCEDSGVWCFDQQAAKDKQWTQYTRKNTGGPDEPNGATIEAGNWLGDDNGYALACDKLGRIWVGHLNHGVSVFNGKQWKNYGVLEGPLGERVFAIKTCPTDGDVWIATSAGLTRYSLSKDAWSYYTRAEGLPSDQASAIAFDKDGNIIIGTQCDGLAFAGVKDDYKTWRQVTCPKEYESRVPLVPKGHGLPTNLINDVLVAKDGTIYVATTTGLAWSKDSGKSFEFVRGKEWAEKVKGLMGGAPKDWKEQPVEGLLAEDYVTRLAEDNAGQLAVGHWQKGCESFDPSKGTLTMGKTSPTVYVSAIVLSPDGSSFFGTYGTGPVCTGQGTGGQTRLAAIPVLPTPAQPLTTSQLTALRDRLAQLPQDARRQVAYAGQDWLTQGDWVYRYGHQFAVLCGNNWPLDDRYCRAIKGVLPYQVTGDIDPRWKNRDSLRRWLHWMNPRSPKVLYSPYMGHRRESEWDDHGEAYPETVEGPDLKIEATVPAGINQVSLYFLNKDGQSQRCRIRDYLIETRAADADPSSPPLARARVRDFWGGLYQRFTVAGPNKYVFTIRRNGSFATICSGVFIDKLAGPSTEIDGYGCPMLVYVKYAPPAMPASTSPDSEWRQLWAQGTPNASGVAAAAYQSMSQLLAYRAADHTKAPEALLANWRWSMRLWSQDDRAYFDAKMAKGWTFLIQHDPTYVDFLASRDKRLATARTQFRKDGMIWVPQD